MALFNTERESLSQQRNENREQVPILEQWREQKYVEIPNLVSERDFANAVSAFNAFRKLPDEIKKAICIEGENGRGAGMLGYKSRSKKTDAAEQALGKHPEEKEYFHYRPDIETMLTEEIQRAGSAGAELMDALRPIWVNVAIMAHDFVRRLEKENPQYAGITEELFSEYSYPRLTVRIMAYKKREPDFLAANAHYDAGRLAFAIRESHGGLQVGIEEQRDKKGRVIVPEHMWDAKRNGDTALVWPGFTLRRLLKDDVPPTWHAVKQPDNKYLALGEDLRDVLVAFLDTPDEEMPRIEETHRV